jgi:hypothetical protein
MSSHVKGIAMDIKTGVSKVVELGKAATAIVMASRETKLAAVIGVGIGAFAVLMLQLVI